MESAQGGFGFPREVLHGDQALPEGVGQTGHRGAAGSPLGCEPRIQGRGLVCDVFGAAAAGMPTGSGSVRPELRGNEGTGHEPGLPQDMRQELSLISGHDPQNDSCARPTPLPRTLRILVRWSRRPDDLWVVWFGGVVRGRARAVPSGVVTAGENLRAGRFAGGAARLERALCHRAFSYVSRYLAEGKSPSLPGPGGGPSARCGRCPAEPLGSWLEGRWHGTEGALASGVCCVRRV